MNRAVSGHFQPGVKENIAYFTHTERRQMMDSQPLPKPPTIKAEPDVSIFRSILTLPKPKALLLKLNEMQV